MHCYGLPQHALGGKIINVASILFRCTFVLSQQYQTLNELRIHKCLRYDFADRKM